MKLAVIGRGMIGSAATRHLAEAGHDVTLIGAGEPADYASHQGVFSSHYDEGRITRGLDESPFWSAVSRASIARYRGLEAATGIRFYEEVGLLMAGPEGESLIDGVVRVAQEAGMVCAQYRGAALAERFPYFEFTDGTLGVFEEVNAGYINPRKMVAAQIKAAVMHSASMLDGVATGVDETASGVQVHVDGERHTFDRVLLATGGFSQVLLGKNDPLTVYARTVALFAIDEVEQARLAGQPSMIALTADRRDPYLLPPIRYPDGRVYLKLGGDPEDVVLPDTQAVNDWFRSGGSAEVGAVLEEAICRRMPGLRFDEKLILPCVTSFTSDALPAIRQVSDKISIAIGGNGKGAKNSDELGRLGAELLLQ